MAKIYEKLEQQMELRKANERRDKFLQEKKSSGGSSGDGRSGSRRSKVRSPDVVSNLQKLDKGQNQGVRGTFEDIVFLFGSMDAIKGDRKGDENSGYFLRTHEKAGGGGGGSGGGIRVGEGKQSQPEAVVVAVVAEKWQEQPSSNDEGLALERETRRYRHMEKRQQEWDKQLKSDQKNAAASCGRSIKCFSFRLLSCALS